jgi:hypothetical protein
VDLGPYEGAAGAGRGWPVGWDRASKSPSRRVSWSSAGVEDGRWGGIVPDGLPGRLGYMDAGLAALLGAAVGSLATLGAAIVNSRAQARAQQDQWRRQQRRNACASYLSALHDRDIAMDAILKALRADEPDLTTVDEKIRHFVDLAREVHRTAEIVILEGPASLAEVAERVTRASRDLSQVMRRMAEDAHAGDSTRKAEDTDLAAERERALYQVIKDFRLAARDTIDSTD